jgi:hypothetical protein
LRVDLPRRPSIKELGKPFFGKVYGRRKGIRAEYWGQTGLKSPDQTIQGVRMGMWSSAGEGTAQGFSALHLAPPWVFGEPKARPILATPEVAEAGEKWWLFARLGSLKETGGGSPSALSESWQKPSALVKRSNDAVNTAKI